ncbi:MAG: zinc ribbon domain-containing protein, partial [Coriobacteriales bacterium]|nr:zinc ribbon domain-containing protein [Coriobacteriales bacterium]
ILDSFKATVSVQVMGEIMFCTGCGKEIPDVSKFCPYCGKGTHAAVAVAGTAVSKVAAPVEAVVAKTADAQAVVAKAADAQAVVAEASTAPAKAAAKASKTATKAAEKTVKAAEATADKAAAAAEKAADKVVEAAEATADKAAKTVEASAEKAAQTAEAALEATASVVEPVVAPVGVSVGEGVASVGTAPVGAPMGTAPMGTAPMGAAPQYAAQYAPQYAPQQPPKKKSKVVPIVIIAAVLLALIGGGVALALNLFSNMEEKTALAALYTGTENLLFEASSATVEARAGVNATVKWDLGKDLKSSTFWGYSGGMGFLLKDDTLIVYEGSSSGGGIEVVTKESGIVSTINDELNRTYNTKLDFNNAVSNGKLNRKFFEELSAEVDKAAGEMSADIDSERITEIVTDFMTKELNKKVVHDKVVLDASSSKNGSTTTHKGRLAPFSLLDELYNYAEDRGKDSRYQDAAKTITDALDSVRSMSSYMGSYLDDVSYEISIANKFLTGLGVTLNTPSGAVSADISINDINATDLSNESLIQEILDAPEKSSNNYWDIFDFGSAF